MKRTNKRFGTAWLAMFAAVALLAQFASVSVARAAPAGHFVEICSSHGSKSVFVAAAPGEPTQAPCSHCDHCLTPSLAAEPAAATLSAEPVRYASAMVVHLKPAAPTAYKARGPPRPHGQAPPISLNV